jgi:hypothetical protein
METKQKKLNAYLFLFTLLAAVTVSMRTIASFISLDRYGYYAGDLCTSANITAALGCLILFTYAFVHRKDAGKVASFGGPLTYAPGAPLAICLVLLGASFFGRATNGALGKLLLPLLGILGIASALYFLFAVLYEIKLCDLRAVFGMVCGLFLVLYAGFLYFDTALPINATTKLTDQAAFVLAALFFLYETRISLGLERWPLYTAFGFIASLLCAYSSIPSLILYFFEGKILSNSIEESFTVFFLFLYIFSRTVLSLLLKSEKATPFMAALHEDAKRLADAVAARGPLPFEAAPEKLKEELPPEAEEASAAEENGEETSTDENGDATEETIDNQTEETTE